MKLKIEICCDNDSFREDQYVNLRNDAIKAILFNISDYPEPGETFRLRDSNGNIVGFIQLEE
jgi:hypothetical protein